MRGDFEKLWSEIKRNPLLSLVLLTVCLSVSSIAFLPEYRRTLFDPQRAGVFGDLVGGFFGPIFSLIGIFFVVLTLREQRDAAVVESKRNDIQAFEDKYYELLRLHRENVSEMALAQGIDHRRVFVFFLDELQGAIIAVQRVTRQKRRETPFSEQLQLAYYCLFFGIDEHSMIALLEALKAAKSTFNYDDLVLIQGELRKKRSQAQPYLYFSGHQSRLGHYYRHLYQMVTFVDDQELDLDKRKAYVKTIRAQLSTHEQAMLLVNSLSGIGWDWWSRDLLQRYSLVKNIPAGFLEAFCSMSATSVFPHGYYEWQQSPLKPAVLGRVKNVS